MKITWYGHAAFLIETSGLRLILDPFSPSSGYDPIDEPADVLAMSQDDDRFHSHVDSVLGDPIVLIGKTMSTAPTVVKGIPFRAVPVWEDLDRTRNRHGMIVFEAEGLRVTHMGDLGHGLNEPELAAIAGTDVLLALASDRDETWLEVSRATLPASTRIVVLRHAR